MTTTVFQSTYLDPSSAQVLSSRNRGRVAGALYDLQGLIASGLSMAAAQAVVAQRPRHIEALGIASREVNRESVRTDFLALT